MAETETEYIIPEGTRAERADKVVARLLPELSRSGWQRVFAAGRIWKEERVLRQKDRLRAGDCISYSIPQPVPLALRPVAMPLAIVHEDADLLVVNKEAGRVVHPGAGTGEDTLVHGLLHHCGDSLTGIGGTERPGIVHRLDKETSGLLVVAKSEVAFRGLVEQFAEREVEKEYIALVAGIPERRHGRIEEAIGRHPTQRTRMCCRADGRAARSDYEVERTWPGAARLRVRIHSGRTHQIRVHLQWLGTPILGDSVYGGRRRASVETGRVMLHAARLGLWHPVKKDYYRWEAPVPADFVEAEKRLEGPESH